MMHVKLQQDILANVIPVNFMYCLQKVQTLSDSSIMSLSVKCSRHLASASYSQPVCVVQFSDISWEA